MSTSRTLVIQERPNYRYQMLHRLYHALPLSKQAPFSKFGAVIDKYSVDQMSSREEKFADIYREYLIINGQVSEVNAIDNAQKRLNVYFDQARRNFYNAISEMERHFNALTSADTVEDFENSVVAFAGVEKVVGHLIEVNRFVDVKQATAQPNAEN